MNNTFQLETERLLITEFTHDDTAFIIQLLNTEGWLRFIGDRQIHNEEAALHYINKLRTSYKDYGFGFWKVSLKQDDIPVGMSGLIKRDDLPHMDIGFAFLPEYFGKGYALESALAVKEYAIEQLKTEDLLAITNTDNTASMKLLEKIGLVFEKNIVMNNEALNLFRLKR